MLKQTTFFCIKAVSQLDVFTSEIFTFIKCFKYSFLFSNGEQNYGKLIHR